MLETLEQGRQTGGVPNSAAPGKSSHPGKPNPEPLAAAQLQTQGCVQSCCVNRGACVLTSSSLGPAPPVPPQNPTQSHCRTSSATGNPRSTATGRRMDHSHSGLQPVGLPGGGEDNLRRTTLRLGVELLTAADATTWLVCFQPAQAALGQQRGPRAGGGRSRAGAGGGAGTPPPGKAASKEPLKLS